MKKIIYITAFALFASACTMEELPKSQVSNPQVFGAETGLEMYINSFYPIFPSSTVNIQNTQSYAVSQVIKYLTENGFSPEEAGGWNWGTLRNINYFIVNNTSPSVPDAVRNNYQGIARFFRAYFYFSMMTKFGDLPWINHPLDVNDPILFSPRDKRTLIIDSIKADLDFAIKNIKASKDASASTITSTVAAAFKSRVCLWEGTYRRYHKEAGLESSANQWLQEAVSAAEVVMNAGYALYTGKGNKSYRALFVASVPVSSEVLYAVTYSGSLGIVHSGNRQWTSNTLSITPCLVRSFVNTYLMTDGTPFTNRPGYHETSFIDEFKDRDLRLSQTVRTPGFTRITNGKEIPAAPVYTYAITGYMPCKFTLDDTYYDNVDACDNNIVVLRYAEVLLNYAEAKAELGTLTDADWERTIGALRKRAGIVGGLTTKPTVADPYLEQNFFPGVTNPEILEIRRERNIELAYEGVDWNDIVRWKLGKQLIKVWDGIWIPEMDVPYDMNGDGILDVCFTKQLDPPNKVPNVYYFYVGERLANGNINNFQIDADGHTLLYMKHQVRSWDDKLYWYPIPASDLTMNPQLGQNPGWK